MNNIFLEAFAKCFGFSHNAEEENRLEMIRDQVEFYFSDMNLEHDHVFLEAINGNPDRYVPISILLGRMHLKLLKATELDVLRAIENSPVFDVDPVQLLVRTKIPFVSDPRRIYRVLEISGMNQEADFELQKQFFETLFKDIRRVSLFKKVKDGQVFYRGRTYVELGSEEEAQKAVEHGIEYGGKMLTVQTVAKSQESLKERQNRKK